MGATRTVGGRVPEAVAAVLVACAAAGAEAREDGSQRELVETPLREVREAGPAPPYLFALPRRASPAEEVRAVRADVGGSRLVLFDIDGDGTFDTPGVDAWRPDDGEASPFAFPVEPEIVLDGRCTRISVDAAEGVLRAAQEDDAWPDDLPAKTREMRAARKEILSALDRWNVLRAANGLPPVYLDADLTRACLEHAAYMQRWGVTHVQEPEKDGYSPDGDRVARSGSVGSLPASEEIVEVYSTFYHRISLFHPGTRGAGIGTSGGHSIFNGTEGRERRAWTWPVLIPAPDTDGVPRTYHSEKPVPHLNEFRDGTIAGGGFPITLTFERDEVTDVVAELRRGGHDGDAVPFSLSSPEHPASSDAPTNYKSICLLPHAALKARTTYWVHVEWTYRGEIDQRTWTFETGR